jgi:hypothetical protein
MEQIKKAAKYYYWVLRREKFKVEYDDIEGELGLTYTEALKTFSPDKNERASFKTYVSMAFAVRIKEMKREICIHTRIMNEHNLWQGCLNGNTLPLSFSDNPETENVAMQLMDGVVENNVVMAELLKTTFPVEETLAKMRNSGMLNRGRQVDVIMAIGKTHGLSKWQIYANIRKAKKFVKKK